MGRPDKSGDGSYRDHSSDQPGSRSASRSVAARSGEVVINKQQDKRLRIIAEIGSLYQ